MLPQNKHTNERDTVLYTRVVGEEGQRCVSDASAAVLSPVCFAYLYPDLDKIAVQACWIAYAHDEYLPMMQAAR